MKSGTHKIHELIVREKLGKITPYEKEILKSWINASADNKRTYNRIVSGETVSERIKLENFIAKHANFKAIHKNISRKLNGRKFYPYRIAAAVSIVLISGGIIFFRNYRPKDTIHPDFNHVILTTESGKRLNLKTESMSSDISGIRIIHGEKNLSYNLPETKQKNKAVHKINTTSGAEYRLILSDGTKVRLNSETELSYPVNFSGIERKVVLKGEAYFEVHPDPHKPFIVETEDISTTVLGTSFNIKAYPEEKTITTTLISGRVSVGPAKSDTALHSVILEPGMQSEWDKRNRNLKTVRANISHAISWIEGIYILNGTDLKTLLPVLSRWYGVKFVYENETVSQNTFYGSICKHESLKSVLKALTIAGGPEFRIEKDIVRIEIPLSY